MAVTAPGTVSRACATFRRGGACNAQLFGYGVVLEAMHARLPISACLAVLALAVVPGQALAGPTITATPENVFTPKTVTVPLNDSVSFTNSGGMHNVAWDDGKVRVSPSADGLEPPWPRTPTRGFTKPGLYRFYCTVHGGPGGLDMSGRVTVLNADGSVARPPAISGATTVSGAGRVTLKFTSSTAGTVAGRLSRKQGRSFRSFGSLKLRLRKGRNSVLVRRTSSGRKLTVGSYQLALAFSDGVSNLTTSKTLKFTISR
jgi:plastocyanin